MSDTIGSLIDKLCTVDLKMWNNQEILFKVRHLSFEDFKSQYLNDDVTKKQLWESLKKTCDLNVQRNNIIDEIDLLFINIIVECMAQFNKNNTDDDIHKKIRHLLFDKFIQQKHKTY